MKAWKAILLRNDAKMHQVIVLGATKGKGLCMFLIWRLPLYRKLITIDLYFVHEHKGGNCIRLTGDADEIIFLLFSCSHSQPVCPLCKYSISRHSSHALSIIKFSSWILVLHFGWYTICAKRDIGGGSRPNSMNNHNMVHIAFSIPPTRFFYTFKIKTARYYDTQRYNVTMADTGSFFNGQQTKHVRSKRVLLKKMCKLSSFNNSEPLSSLFKLLKVAE